MTSMLKHYQYPLNGKMAISDYWHSYPGLTNRGKPAFFGALGASPFRLFKGEDNAGFALPAPTDSNAVTTRPGNENSADFFHLNLQFQLRFSLQTSIRTLIHRKVGRGILLKTSKVKERKSLVHKTNESLENFYHLGGSQPVPGLTSPHRFERLLHPEFFSPTRLRNSVLQRGGITDHSLLENFSRDDCDEADELQRVTVKTEASGQQYETDASVLMDLASPRKGHLRPVQRSELVSSNAILPGARNHGLDLLRGNPLFEQTKAYQRMASVATQFERYDSALTELSPLQTLQVRKAHTAIRDLQAFQNFFAAENKRYQKGGDRYKDPVEQRLSESVVSELRQRLLDLQRANSADSKALLQAIQSLAEVVEYAVTQNSAGQSSTMRPLNFLGPL